MESMFTPVLDGPHSLEGEEMVGRTLAITAAGLSPSTIERPIGGFKGLWPQQKDPYQLMLERSTKFSCLSSNRKEES